MNFKIIMLFISKYYIKMDNLESTINFIRDVLRKEGITGMDSINHCIVFLMCKMLDEKLCEKVNIDKKFAFENLLLNEKGKEIGNQDLYGKIYTKKIGEICLIGELFNKLQFRNIKFKLEGPINLRAIIDRLKNIDVHKLSTKYDLIGTIYELHLKSGTSSSMRDLGQYYTNRQVIKYMIGLCDPKMVNGKIEKIADPTMGTGGFLTMSIKYLNEKYNKIDWSQNKDNIIGFDIDDNVRNMALINIFLEINELCSNSIIKHDTLHYDMKFRNGIILEKADVILANEPMGLKNIIYDNCCGRIKELGIKGTKAEPLFLQLFMEALNENGRCAVIVPDGVLFNNNKLYVGTRKYLMENFSLKKVISLNDDFFLNTGVKTSILFFENNGYQTSKVEFSEIKLNNGEIDETSIVKVKISKIEKNNYSLFVNKYTIKEEPKIEGIEYEKLGNICKSLPKSKRHASFGSEHGQYNFYTSSPKVMKCDECDYKDECIIIGTGGNANIKYDVNFSCSMDNIILKSEKHKTKYVYYYLKTNMNLLENGFAGSTIRHISNEYINNIEIPIPSIDSQNEFVSYCEKCDEEVKEIERKMKEYPALIRDKLTNILKK